MREKSATSSPSLPEEKFNAILDKLATEATTLQSAVSWLSVSEEKRSAPSKDGYCRQKLLRCLRRKFLLLLRDPTAGKALPSCRSQISCGSLTQAP